MSGINKALALVGIALQAARDQVADAAQFAHGIRSGSPLNPDVKVEDDPVTSGNRFSTSSHRSEISNGAAYTFPAYFRVLGLYLLAVMGGLQSAAADALFAHTFVVADTIPYLTYFGDLAGKIGRIANCKVAELSLKWEGNKPLDISVVLVGCEMDPLESFTAEELEGGDDRFTPVGGTFKVSTGSSTPAVAAIVGGEVKLINKVTGKVLSGTLTPSDVDEATFEGEISVTVEPDDLALWDALEVGEDAIVNGSFEFGFVGAGGVSLVLSGTKVPFVIPFPDADPAGGNARLELTGLAKGTVEGGSPITVVLTNDVETYSAPAGS